MALTAEPVIAAPAVHTTGPAYFYRRFADGVCDEPRQPRITRRETESLFAQRDEGLHVLLINAPIREWSYPNIMPIGHG